MPHSYWSGYARLERDGHVWRAIKPVGEQGSVVIEVRPEAELSDAMGHWLISALQRGLQDCPEWLLARWKRQAGSLPNPEQLSESAWTWLESYSGVGFSVVVVLPPGFETPDAVVQRMALCLRGEARGPQSH